MKIKMMKEVICRTPAFGIETDLEEVWEELKEKINESSPAFYQLVQHVDYAALGTLAPKVRFTLWKYFSRARFRATPFGSFSALSLLGTSAAGPTQLMLSKALTIKHFNDWSEKERFTQDLHKVVQQSTLFFKNTSAYKVMEQIRYIRLKDGKFELSTVESFPQLQALLSLCEVKQPLDVLCECMKAEFGLERKHTITFLAQLIGIQLVFTDRFPNIIGEDYFTRLGQSKPEDEKSYIISSRPILGGSLGEKELMHLPKLIDLLSTNQPDVAQNELDKFKRAFIRKFERREVSLAQVMDPEIGISYGGLAQQPDSETVEQLKTPRQPNNQLINLAYTKLHSFILDQLPNKGPIQLDRFSYVPDGKARLGNTLSVLFHLYRGNPVIEGIFATSAAALVGRFTLLSPAFHNYAKSIAALEQQANPNVLFFDIGYQAEKHIDNVNRRKSIYPHELPILSWSCDAQPLDFSDIMVSVIGNEVILRSKKYNKRLIPRIPSAYNYTRSDLAAYRFLCDIQNQQLHNHLGFELKNYFPNLNHYPRVNFMNLVISPAMWKVPSLFLTKEGQDIEALSTWLEQMSIDFRFKVGDGDQTLCFDPALKADLEAFLQYCRQQSGEQLYLAEALIESSGSVRDEHGKDYLAQFIVNYYHENEIYPALKAAEHHAPGADLPSLLLPGSEWLYYELYCYPTWSNILLIEQISPLLKQIRFAIRKWFFIRYDDPTPHIRLRLHLKDPALATLVNQKLNQSLAPFLQSGQLSDLCIRPYHREMERYGAARIEAVENFFYADSAHVMAQLRKSAGTEELYIQSIDYLYHVLLQDLDTMGERIALAKMMAGQFASEHKLSPLEFKTLNRSFNELKTKIKPLDRLPNPYPSQKKAAAKALKGTTCEVKQKLIADLVHMHVNRMFPSDQRLHETVVYHYLVRTTMAFREPEDSPEV